MTDVFAELDAEDAALRAAGRPMHWKPKGSHRRNKPKRHGREPWCHHYSRKDVEYVQRSCAWGYCIAMCCPTCGQIAHGWGPIACPCDHTNGWKSRYVEGQAKPHPPVKAKGRHHDRIRNAERRHRAREAVTAKWTTLFSPTSSTTP